MAEDDQIFPGTDMEQTAQRGNAIVCTHCQSNRDLFTCFCKVRICGSCNIGCKCQNADGSSKYPGTKGRNTRASDWNHQAVGRLLRHLPE